MIENVRGLTLMMSKKLHVIVSQEIEPSSFTSSCALDANRRCFLKIDGRKDSKARNSTEQKNNDCRNSL